MPKTEVSGFDRNDADALIDQAQRLTVRLVRDAERFCKKRGKQDYEITLASFTLLHLITHNMLRVAPKDKQLKMLWALHNAIEMEIRHGDPLHGTSYDA